MALPRNRNWLRKKLAAAFKRRGGIYCDYDRIHTALEYGMREAFSRPRLDLERNHLWAFRRVVECREDPSGLGAEFELAMLRTGSGVFPYAALVQERRAFKTRGHDYDEFRRAEVAVATEIERLHGASRPSRILAFPEPTV